MRQIAPACGVVAVSKAGRDAGRSFVILQVLDDQYVLIADGELRKVQNPKRKNYGIFLSGPMWRRRYANVWSGRSC